MSLHDHGSSAKYQLSNLNTMGLLGSFLIDKDLPSLIARESRQFNWVEEEDFRYCALNETGVLKHYLSNFLESSPSILTDYEFELVEIFGEIKPHHHRQSDGIAICERYNQSGRAYFEINGKGTWSPLMARQIIILPRGINHGFKVGSDEVSIRLLTIFSPRIDEADVHYA